jgi:MAD (mothers against decapentaplegic) interacting protein
VFPLRLLLRLGAESRYYPSPLWSWRDRTTVYKEIGNTIMKLLSDFRNFTYSLPIIRGMVIHMEDKLTTVLIPQNNYAQIQKALQNSNDPVLALGGNFSPSADSHLVAVQRDEDEPSRNALNNSDYETQAINIQNKARKVTGASFIVLNGALKSASGLTAKSSIVEDGIMVQVSQDRMMAIRKSLNSMEDIKIACGPVGSDTPDETVHIKWVDAHHSVNAGYNFLFIKSSDSFFQLPMFQFLG